MGVMPPEMIWVAAGGHDFKANGQHVSCLVGRHLLCCLQEHDHWSLLTGLLGPLAGRLLTRIGWKGRLAGDERFAGH